jgi:hypothetical protein
MRASERRKRDDLAAAVWKERELVGGKVVDAGVVILRTSGCRHFREGGCSMCGYNIESSGSVTGKDIEKQYAGAIGQLQDIGFVKIYTSGSFLDECEVPPETADLILRDAADKGLRVLFETRPEFVTPDRLRRITGITTDLEIALGLESANDRILRYSINKGFTARDYDRASDEIASNKIDVRTYVLLKPPFLTEAEAIADAKATIRFAAHRSKTISLNPVNVQKGTFVEKLWKNWAYRPPWLWSVLDVLRSSGGLGARIVCDPAGGGRERGAHNCGDCDEVILDSVKAFSLSQDYSRLGAPECSCRDIWTAILDSEDFVMGGTVDLQRHSRPRR